MSRYVKTFKFNDGDKDKSNKLMSFCTDDERLLERYKAIWTKIEDSKNNKSNALPFYDHRYITTKIRTYSNKHTNFFGLNVPGDHIDCESFRVISIDSLSIIKYCLQVYLDNCAYKITSKQMTDYLDDNLFED